MCISIYIYIYIVGPPAERHALPRRGLHAAAGALHSNSNSNSNSNSSSNSSSSNSSNSSNSNSNAGALHSAKGGAVEIDKKTCSYHYD